MTSDRSCTLTCPAQTLGEGDYEYVDNEIVAVIVQMSLSTLRVLRCELSALEGMFVLKILLLVDQNRLLWLLQTL